MVPKGKVFGKTKGKLNGKPKRKFVRKVGNKIAKSRVTKSQKRVDENEEIPSDSDAENQSTTDFNESKASKESDDFTNETAEEKRMRYAKEYLKRIQSEENIGEKSEMDSDENEIISNRLKENRLASKAQLERDFASKFENIDFSDPKYEPKCMIGHRQTVTCVSLSGDDSFALSGSKDNSLIKWDIETGRRTVLIRSWGKCAKDPKLPEQTNQARHEILAVAVSMDGRYGVSAGRDKLVKIWDFRTNENVKTFKGHQDAVTCAAFDYDSYNLFTGSLDRSVKHWTVEEMGYIETLFGHQSHINAIDAFRSEIPITGSRDNTVRGWKISAQTHLVYRPAKGGSVDAVCYLNNNHFLSGGEDGCVSLWNAGRKKPIFSTASNLKWITSIGSIKSSNIVFTGSNEGFIKLWKVSLKNKKMKEINKVPMNGFINGIGVANSGKFLIVGAGKEHRLGRWHIEKNAKNGLFIIPLS